VFKNYLKIALRKIRQHKMYSFITIGGLAVGMAGFLLISIYVYHEMCYDRFHKHGKNIYRVYRIEDDPSGRITSASTPHALPKALANDFPNLVNVVSIATRELEMNVQDRHFQEKVLVASSNFFNSFDFPFILGSPKKLSENIQNIVITKRLANKLFGHDSPMGKIITVQKQIELIVAGVIENVPTTSSFQFDAFVSNDFVYKTILRDEESKWYSMGVETFVEFPPHLSPETLQAQFPTLLKKYLPDYLQGRLDLGLQPLYDIHTNTQIASDKFPAISRYMLGLLFLIACAILGISSMNFINLTISRYTERLKEIGIRNVVGANRWQLVQQFLTESILLTFCALIVGFVLVQWMLPYFNEFMHRQLTFDLFKDKTLLTFTVGFGLLLGVLNGSYPAFLLSAYKPVSLLKIEQKKFFGRTHLRYVLVTLQFSITIVLIFCVLVISSQIAFMKYHDLGFLSQNLIAIPTNTNPIEEADQQKIRLFTEIIQEQGSRYGIASAAYSENVPGSNFGNLFSVIPEHGSEKDRIEMVVTRNLNEDLFKTYRMEIVQGRNFSKTYSTDATEGAVINETAAKKFGWDTPVGKRFRFAFLDEFFTVIGVMRDIHFRSLQNKIEPLVFVQRGGMTNFVTVRIQSDNIQKSVAFLKQEWQKIFPSFNFEYRFVEDLYKESYKEEERLLRIILIFSALAIGLASLGLLGLSALISVQRTKEIGIRKTLGASTPHIVFMLSKDFTRWIIVANIIAWPLAWYIMNKWLQDFAYRIDISLWVFILSGGIALLIALLTVSFQAIKAATANPVEALRYE
jgi:putative ABC transport system permease protein